jgi:hypothetical protein
MRSRPALWLAVTSAPRGRSRQPPAAAADVARLYEGGPFVKPCVRFLTPLLTHPRVSAAVSSA